MKEFIKIAQNHRTIREFTGERVPGDDLELILDTVMRTATSTGMQLASIIRVTDQDKKDAISKICNQDYVARAPELLIFIVDFYRNYRIMEDTDQVVQRPSDVDIFFQGYTDAALMAQNTTNMLESMGYGAVFLGSILNDPQGIIDILDLPKLTFPVLGLAFGYPDQEPQLKPRLSVRHRVFENTYKVFDNYKEELGDYDQEMTTYYDLRENNTRSDSFFNQVVNKAKKQNPKRLEILNVARKNGFNL